MAGTPFVPIEHCMSAIEALEAAYKARIHAGRAARIAGYSKGFSGFEIGPYYLMNEPHAEEWLQGYDLGWNDFKRGRKTPMRLPE